MPIVRHGATAVSGLLAVVALAACLGGKWWGEPFLQHTRLSNVSGTWQLTTRYLSSVDGSILWHCNTVHLTPAGRDQIAPGVPPSGTRYGVRPPGDLFSGQAPAFPRNLWFDVYAYSGAGRRAGVVGQDGRNMRIPWWPIIALFAAAPASALVRRRRRGRYAARGGCRDCGYDLRHSPERCPECGSSCPAEGLPPPAVVSGSLPRA